MNELTILVWLVCNQPVYVQYLEPTGEIYLYSKTKSAEIWTDVLGDVIKHKVLGHNVVEFKVEDQMPNISCNVST